MKRPVITLVAVCAALPALAQDAVGDWDIHSDASIDSLMAYTVFDNGLSIAFRCIDGSLNVVMAGLPPAPGDRRTLNMAFRDGQSYPTVWTATTSSTAVVGDFPAPLAREFRQGGTLKVSVPGGALDGRYLRYDVELPASGAAIDQVLTTCDRPLVDPRDAALKAIDATGLSTGVSWERTPRGQFPTPIRYGSGFAVLSCLTTPTGDLNDCVVEMEHPHDGKFGRAALRGAAGARLKNSEGEKWPMPVVRLSFMTRFQFQQ